MLSRLLMLSLAAALLTGAPAAWSDTPPVTIDGLVKAAQHVTADDLHPLPAVERRVTFATDHGPQTATYKGVLLWSLVARAGVNDPAKWGELRHVAAITASDGYLVMISLGEIDPNFGNAPAMLAYERDGKPLAALRLVFPGDRHGARDVRGVVRIEIR
jgi:DMSO/TMAO reductase YedYZ molybdopterin-dependent catalytic subunit